MQHMAESCGDKAYILSALGASYPEKNVSHQPGSIDVLYEKVVAEKPYFSTGALSPIEKLTHMLVADELSALLKAKAARRSGNRNPLFPRTKLDRVIALWERIFPGNHILRETGTILFSNDCAADTVTFLGLSQGEKAVFYYIAGVLYAMPDATIFIDSPSLFLHPSMLGNFWNAIEELRPDCRFVYNTVDMDFVGTRTANICIWVKRYDAELRQWDYEILDSPSMSEELFLDIIGTRNPVLFIEGDSTHSIDGKLYPLVFPEYTVRPLGSCNKVIESTRTFNDLKGLHHLDSHGIVDRDRRTDAEVNYLRKKHILVPNVAEIENIFLLEDVIAIMARRRGKEVSNILTRVKHNVLNMFTHHFNEQALLHVRHKVKRDVECKVDARFTCITALETHLRNLADRLNPREYYNLLRQEFQNMIDTRDYAGILRVFNHKPILPDSNVASMLGYKSKEEYIAGVIATLKGNGKDAIELRNAIRNCFGLPYNSVGEEIVSTDDISNSQILSSPKPPTEKRKNKQAIKKQAKRNRASRRRPRF